MREIKLRIRLKSNYKDEYCTIFNSVFDKNIGIAFYPINKEEWGIVSIDEFTGLHDKNGKEIYEGDILKTEEYDEAGVDCGYTFQVEWFQDDINCGWNIARSDCWSAEIIGDIHENPELIK